MEKNLIVPEEEYRYRESSLEQMFRLLLEIASKTGSKGIVWERFQNWRKIFDEYDKAQLESKEERREIKYQQSIEEMQEEERLFGKQDNENPLS